MSILKLGREKMPKIDQKGIVHLLPLLLLLGGLVAAVYLVQQTQIFKPKASGGLLELVKENGETIPAGPDGSFQVGSPQIRIKIHQPDWKGIPQSLIPGLVASVFAQSTGSCGNSWNNQPTKCADSSGKASDGTQCSGSYLGAYTGCSGNTSYCYSCPGTGTGTGTGSGASGASSQGTTCVTNSFSNQPTKCADSLGKAADGATCSTYLGGFTGCSGNQPYCYSGCSGGQPASQTGQPGQPAQPQIDNTTPIITGAPWGQDGSYLTITGTNFGNSQGTVYYSRGGNEQIQSQSVSSWSPASIKMGAEIPLGAVRSVDNAISEGNYLKVCRADGKCSAFWSPIPDRPRSRVLVPAAPAAPVGGQPTVSEATVKMRISQNPDRIKSDEACIGDADPNQHCLSFTYGELRAKGYIDWWLGKEGENIVYVGFVSDKGRYTDRSVKVRLIRPAPQPVGGGGRVGDTNCGVTSMTNGTVKFYCQVASSMEKGQYFIEHKYELCKRSRQEPGVDNSCTSYTKQYLPDDYIGQYPLTGPGPWVVEAGKRVEGVGNFPSISCGRVQADVAIYEVTSGTGEADKLVGLSGEVYDSGKHCEEGPTPSSPPGVPPPSPRFGCPASSCEERVGCECRAEYNGDPSLISVICNDKVETKCGRRQTPPPSPIAPGTPTCEERVRAECARKYASSRSLSYINARCNEEVKDECEGSGAAPPATAAPVPAPAPGITFDSSRSCIDQYDQCVKDLQAQGRSWLQADEECEQPWQVCRDEKGQQCDKEYNVCMASGAFNCLLPNWWCKSRIK